MNRSQRISKILNKINERFHLLFEWLACEDTGRDWDGIGNPYAQSTRIAGQDGATGGQDSDIVKNS
jgi:hypothetical protein